MPRLLLTVVFLLPQVALGQNTDLPAPPAGNDEARLPAEASVPEAPDATASDQATELVPAAGREGAPEPAGVAEGSAADGPGVAIEVEAIDTEGAAEAMEVESTDLAPVEQPCDPDCQSAPAGAHPEAGWRSETSGFVLSFDGYLRLEAGSLLPDRFLGIRMPASYKRESPPAVGRNDGFGLGGARLNVRGELGDVLYVRLAFDGAVVSYEDDGPVGDLTTGLKDAYVRYTFRPLLEVFAGRFKPPYDVEELTPQEDQLFVHRSLESRGVARHEGPSTDLFGVPNQGGFAPGRQLGIMIAGETGGGATEEEGGGMTWGYALALTNGNSGGASLNDNDLPATYVRVYGVMSDDNGPGDEEGPATYGTAGGLVVGLGAFYNEIATGLPPTRFRDRIAGAGLDVSYSLAVFTLQGQALIARLSPVTREDAPAVTSVGGHVQLAVQIPGMRLFPGYRFAYFDPRYVSDEDATAGGDQDRVMHHTLGVRYSPEDLPLVLHLEYTRSVEQDGRVTQNDRVEAAMQVTF